MDLYRVWTKFYRFEPILVRTNVFNVGTYVKFGLIFNGSNYKLVWTYVFAFGLIVSSDYGCSDCLKFGISLGVFKLWPSSDYELHVQTVYLFGSSPNYVGK